MLNYIRKYKFEYLLGLAILVYIILFSCLSLRKLLTFQSHYFDLGIMNQLVYNTSRGWFLEMTNQDFLSNVSRFAIHFDPILAFFAPFYLLFNTPEVLLIGQTIILASGAIAVYLIGQKIIKNKLYSLFFAFSYLLYFPVERANTFDFHAVVLATSFLLFSIYFYLTKKRFWSLIFIILSLLTKEHVGLVTFLFGLYLLLTKKEKRFAWIVMFISLFTFVLTVFYIIPHSRHETHFALSRYEDFGDTPGTVLLGTVTNPLTTLKYFLRRESFTYLYRLLLPYGIFVIFAPLEFLIAAPELGINLLSANPNMRAAYFHYNSLIVPFVLFSAIVGFERLRRKVSIKKYLNGLIVIFIILNLVNAYYLNPLPFSFLKQPFWWGKINEEKLKTVYTWQQVLKDDNVKVATTPQLAPFFSARRYYYNFLYDPAFASMGLTKDDIIKAIANYVEADFVIINKSEIGDETKESLPAEFYNHLKKNDSFTQIFENAGIEVYKKINSPTL